MPEDLGDVSTVNMRESIAQIRFALNQLSARNGAHEFEEMTRFLAKETVCRNILPATGPVSAGGDQGRDFETYRSYVAGQVLDVGVQIGIAEGEGVTFACTLQAHDVGSKILSDVAKIVSDGASTDHIVYYCEANVPVGRRHTMQSKVHKEHGVHLEIFDGSAIADILSQRSLFWIAQEFLHLPANALPPTPERPDWYEADRRRWSQNDHTPTTPGDLVDLSGCLRYATFHETAVPDLPFWIQKIEALDRDAINASIRQKARYEIVVAQLRGLGDLRPTDALVSTYLEAAMGTEDAAELDDAAVLLMYCIGARGRGLTTHSEEQLLVWNGQLQAQVLRLLEATDRPGRRCTLLATLGWLRSQPDLVATRESGIDYSLGDSVPRISLDQIDEISRRGLLKPIEVPTVDVRGAFDAWTEMVELLPRAPLFPVERLGEMMRITAHLLVVDPRYDRVVAALDQRIAEIAGGDAAASNARDRAMGFYGHGRLLDSLREIHRARMGWFSGETADAMILTTLMMSQVYRDLELPEAAKYAAMTAARLVGPENEELYARACFKAAEADYHQAAWFSTVHLIDLGLRAHLLLAENPHDWERHDHLQYVFFELAIIRAIAAAAGGSYQEFVTEILGRTDADVALDELLDEPGVAPWWEALSIDELVARVAEQLRNPAFSDGGERRSLSWRALGVTWSVEFPNDYETTVVGERLAAFAQMALAEFARHDPALLPTSVNFAVSVIPEGDEVRFQCRSDGRGTRWEVSLPRAGSISEETIRKLGQETLSVVIAAIADVSIIPQEEFSLALDLMFEDGLLDKLSFGTIYDVAYRNLVSREMFDEAPRSSCQPLVPDLSPGPRQAADLSAAGPGPHYEEEKSVELIASRYEKVSNSLIATLPALRSHPPFRDVVADLRDDGWKDWHILLATYQIARNDRVSLRRPPRNEREAKQLFEMFTRAEEPGDDVPLELYTADALRQAIRFSWPSTLKLLDLELRQNPPDLGALETLLAHRYEYWTHDVPHEDPFIWE